ncbi:glycoside hydrolase family 78 protein [Paenibacillus kobensis]|uniref:glycoside hydrolase family 78 protein n=1 Tax=Paenibacillus kobensis TaxID=59841 RepID=UPI000FDA29C4|nr:hypothetical protein [Paenibacillus kobensis]
MIYRYYIPVLFEIQLDGREVVHHYLTDGTNIDADFPNQSFNVSQGGSLALTPATNSKYEYVGYKKSTEGPPSGGTISSGTPPDVTYNGAYDIYHVNLYYKVKTDNGIAHIRHLDRNGNPIPGLTDRDEELIANQPFRSDSTPPPANYKYAGYVKTTTGDPPNDFANPTPAPAEYPPIATYNPASFKTLYLYYVYDVVSAGKVHVRHMAKTGAAGSYKKVGEKTIPITTLPSTRTEYADSSYGTVLGNSVGFTAYTDTPASSSNSAYVSVNAASPEVFITFFYQGTANFTGDFDVLPDTISYGGGFKFHPRDFELNGCVYRGHYYKIERDGASWESSVVNGMTTDSVYTSSSYPWLIGAGSHAIYMKIITDCGTSSWIGPKTLAVTSPNNNNPPTIKGGFVRPGDSSRTIVREVVEGSRLDLKVWDAADPDRDQVIFDGYDFAAGDAFIRSIPAIGTPYGIDWSDIPMTALGYHTVKAYVHDQWGATGSVTIMINVVPHNPVAVIDGPDFAIEGRPLSVPLTSDRSYSPAQRTIDHNRDEWKNKKTVYTTPGSERIELDVYDSLRYKSLTPAVYNLLVKPDLPPDVKIGGMTTSVRKTSNPYTISITSPDGDKIVSETVKEWYDSDNDGSYADETPVTLSMNAQKTVARTYATVGKRKLEACGTEDWGKSACASIIIDVINDSPFVSFEMKGDNTSPPLYGKTYKLDAATLFGPAWKTTAGSKGWMINPADNGLLAPVNGLKSKAEWKGPSAAAVTESPPGQTKTPLYDDYAIVIRPYVYGPSNRYTQGYVVDVYKGDLLLRSHEAVSDVRVDSQQQILYMMDDKMDYLYTFSQLAQGLPAEKSAPALSTRWWSSAGDASWLSQDGGTVNQFYSVKPFKFNTDLKSIFTMRNFPAADQYQQDQLVNYTYDSPYRASTTVELADDLPPGAFSVRNGNEVPITPISHPLGYDAKGNFYYESFSTWSSRPEPGRSVTFNNVSLTKLDGITGQRVYTVADDYLYVMTDFITVSEGYSPGGVIASDPDGNIAYVYRKRAAGDIMNAIVVVRDASGNAMKSLTLTDGKSQMIGSYQDKMIVLSGSNLIAYRFHDLSVAWSTALGSGNITPNNENNILTTNGYWYFVTNYVGTNRDHSVRVADLNNGAVSTIYRSSTLFNSIAPQQDGQLLLSDGSDPVMLITSIPQDRTEDAYGQFYSDALPRVPDFTFSFKMKYTLNSAVKSDVSSGVSFRMKDANNMYRVEASNGSVRLVKIDSGVRSVIKQAAYSMQRNVYSSFIVKAIGESIKVYVNGAPLIDAADATFTTGMFGPYGNIELSVLKDMELTEIIINKSVTPNTAIVQEPVNYVITNMDTENDPLIPNLTKWTYTKTNDKFLDANDGLSGPSELEGKTFTIPRTTFDKVGVYEVSYSVTDDPYQPVHAYPDPMFASYQAKSNTAVSSIIVHRRPIAKYEIFVNADGTLIWSDASYDPDRYLSRGNISQEVTGIDYRKTKGVLEKKFYYITPSGRMVNEKLVAPQEKGKYEIGLMVRDEYDAWSDWYTITLDVSKTAVSNSPPVAGFTSSHINTFRGVPIVFESTAYDFEDGARENLPHEYYLKNLTANSPESLQSTSRTNWSKTFTTLGMFKIRQTVEDSLGVSAQAELQVTIHNRLPVAKVKTPDSSDQTIPTKFDTLRPTFKWTYDDADGDLERQYQVRVYRYGGVLQADSNAMASPNGELAFTAPEDLPENVKMYVVIRVHDGFDWSDWSEPKFFYIETNQPPAADFDWTPKPVWEGDTLKLIDRSADPDGDVLTTHWTIVTPSLQTLTYNSEPVISNVMPGVYRVRLEVSDGRATASVTKDITVTPLTIEADIRHTDDWKQIHDQEGHETRNNPKDFYAGEVMLTNVRTTMGARVRSVKVKLIADGLDGTDLTMEWRMNQSGSLDRFEAEVIDSRWSSLKSGLSRGKYDLQFIAVYDNGVTKSTKVPFRIIGPIQETVEVHRRQ